jgi:hypothetical protein
MTSYTVSIMALPTDPEDTTPVESEAPPSPSGASSGSIPSDGALNEPISPSNSKDIPPSLEGGSFPALPSRKYEGLDTMGNDSGEGLSKPFSFGDVHMERTSLAVELELLKLRYSEWKERTVKEGRKIVKISALEEATPGSYL